MKHLIALLVFAAATSASAATFKPIKWLTDSSMQDLASDMSIAARFESAEVPELNGSFLYGDINISNFSYENKESEKTANTVKQLLMKEGLINSEEISQVKEIDPLKDHQAGLRALNYEDRGYTEEQEAKIQEDADTIQERLIELGEYGMKSYLSQHADEDGTWTVLVSVDLENKQIVVIKLGFSGT